jgi:hypothetical protein
MHELVSRDLCGRHLKLAIAIYRSKEPLEIRERKLGNLMRESDDCESCLKLRQERVGPLMVAPDPHPSWGNLKGIETWRIDLDDAPKYSNRKDKRQEMLELKGLLPAPELPTLSKKKLHKIRDVPSGRTPASALLNDGTLLPRVVFVTEAYAVDEGLPLWFHFVRANMVADVLESPCALPLEVRKRLFRQVETSMSSLEFVLIMKDGIRIPYWYPAPGDFAELPEGYRQDDVTDVEFGRGFASAAKVAFSPLEFVYCVYR